MGELESDVQCWDRAHLCHKRTRGSHQRRRLHIGVWPCTVHGAPMSTMCASPIVSGRCRSFNGCGWQHVRGWSVVAQQPTAPTANTNTMATRPETPRHFDHRRNRGADGRCRTVAESNGDRRPLSSHKYTHIRRVRITTVSWSLGRTPWSPGGLMTVSGARSGQRNTEDCPAPWW